MTIMALDLVRLTASDGIERRARVRRLSEQSGKDPE
jgi:hypothetical protein